MADWSYGPNDAATVKRYSHLLYNASIQRTTVWKLCQVGSSMKSAENPVQVLDDLKKGEGDQITYKLLAELDGDGVQGDNELSGNEESLTPYTDSLVINQLRHPVKIKGAMSQQRVPENMRDEAQGKLATWWRKRLNVSLINQMAGNTHQTDTRYTGNQAAIAPDADHWLIAGPHALESQITSADYFTLGVIDDAVGIAHTLRTPIRSLEIPGVGEVFGLIFLHPYQTRALRKNYTTGQWGDIQKAALAANQASKQNPIFSGAIGFYAGCVIHEDAQMPYGSDAQALGTDGKKRFNSLGIADQARAVYVGPQAITMAMGRAYDTPTRVKWAEEQLDGFNQLRVTAGMIFGMKKTRFNSQDFGVITISTYALSTGY